MDANIYETSGRRGKTSLSAFTDEIEGELEKISVFGVHMTRKVVLTIVGLVVGVSLILGVSLGTSSSSGGAVPEYDFTLADKNDHKFWSLGQLIESAVGTGIYEEGTDKYNALVWLADNDPKRLDANSPMEEVLQRFVLADFYFSTNFKGDDEWKNTYNFLSKKSVCRWNDKTHGVFCNDNDEVTAILMPENNIYGTIPHDIGLLSNMERFNLTQNKLYGEIPASIGVMSTLTDIDLSLNKITGSIPRSIAMLSELVHLDLGHNLLEGSDDIDLIKELPNLEELYLNNNRLQGKIGQFGGSHSLRIIDLSFNSFGGTLLTKVPDGKSLNILRLNNNEIEGTIPESFGKLVNTSELDISVNKITGPLPSSLGNLESLEILRLSDNEIESALPSELRNLEELRVLEASNNAIPSFTKELFTMKNLEMLSLHDNKIAGSIPDEIGFADSLVFLDLSHNKITNKLPVGITNLYKLEYLFLNDNLFDGEIPSEIQGLYQLRELDISNTNFFGSMESQFCDDRPESGNPIVHFKANCLLSEINFPCATECCDGKDNCCLTEDPDCTTIEDEFNARV